MKITIRGAKPADILYLREMLYEAVYWRAIAQGSAPSFDDGMAAPGVSAALSDWAGRSGDTGVIATDGSVPVGACWYRFHTKANAIRGFIDEATPVIVIAVSVSYRKQGIGSMLLDALLHEAKRQKLERVSLMVSQNNNAIYLYRKLGFEEHEIVGDSLLMVRTV